MKHIWRRDTRSPDAPFHRFIPATCEHSFTAQHDDTLYTNDPAYFPQGGCDGTPGRGHLQLTFFQPNEPEEADE